MQDPATIKFHSLDLSQYGKTPQGKPLYRIVWADSRVEKVQYEGRMHEINLYSDTASGKWIMEKWLPAERFAGSREAFAKQGKEMGVEMEYPIDGEYDLSGIFPGEVTPSLAYLWASGINFDQANHTPAERARAVREAYAESKKMADEKKDAIIQNVVERTHA